MTTQEKIAAINQIVTNHQDNVAAVNASAVTPGLSAVVIEAMNDSLKADLDTVFAAAKRPGS